MPKTEDMVNELIKAGQFDVHKWSDYPEVKGVVDTLLGEVFAFRKDQNPNSRIVKPDKIKKHLRVLVIDLYVASQGSNPWRGVSKRKEDYRKKESRYRKIFLTYDFLIPLINDLGSLGYIEEAPGFYDKIAKKGLRTRIRATEKLLSFIEWKEFGVLDVIEKVGLAGLVIDNPEAQREVIILRDENKKSVEYEDDDNTNAMRHNLELINAKLQETRITLRASNEQFEEIRQRLIDSKDEDREPVDFFHKTLHRVFNSDFQHGGRFYGGWWIGLPKEYRKYIEINHKGTVEVDFSAHHIRMLYARDGHEPPNDPYEIENCPFGRDVLKQVFLVLINASDRTSTLKACAKEGIKGAAAVLKTFEKEHQRIAHYFYSGEGVALQCEDSILAEEVMLRMMKLGATVLPVHDSFIVRNSYEPELKEVMEQVFAEMYQAKAVMKTKPTVLDKDEDEGGVGNWKDNLVTDDIEEIYKNEESYSMVNRIWGGG